MLKLLKTMKTFEVKLNAFCIDTPLDKVGGYGLTMVCLHVQLTRARLVMANVD